MYNIKIKTLVLAGWLIQSAAWSQDATNSVAAPNNIAATNSIADEITAVVMKVNDKLQAGKGTEADLADELRRSTPCWPNTPPKKRMTRPEFST